jgi:WD40 repeat protein
MSESLDPEPKQRKRWLPWLQFSLRTLVIVALLIGSAMTVWRRREPWVIEMKIGAEHPPKPAGPYDDLIGTFNERAIHAAIYSPRGNYILLTKGDQTGRVVNAADGKQISELSGSIYELGYFVFSPDEKFIYGLDVDTHLRIWETATGDGRILVPSRVGSDTVIALSPDGKTLLFTEYGPECRIRLWDTRTWTETRDLKMDGFIEHAVFSPDSRLLAATDNGSVIRIWDLTRSSDPVLCGENILFKNISKLLFSPDGRRLAGLDRGVLRVFDAKTGNLLYKVIEEGEFFSGVFTPDGRRLLLDTWVKSARQSSIRILNAENGVQLAEWTNWSGILAFSPDAGRLLVSRNFGLHVLDADDGQELLSVSYSFNSRGSFGAAGMGSRTREARWEGCYRYTAPFSPDGTRLIVPDDPAVVWHRRRPEYWWGIAWLPEFWMTVLFAAALVWSVWRDTRPAVRMN